MWGGKKIENPERLGDIIKVSATDVRHNLGAAIWRARRGECVLISNDGEVVAAIITIEQLSAGFHQDAEKINSATVGDYTYLDAPE